MLPPHNTLPNYPYFSPFSSSLSLLFSPSSSHPSSLFCPFLILPPLYYNVIMFCSCRRINMIICNGCKSYLALQSTVHQDDYITCNKSYAYTVCSLYGQPLKFTNYKLHYLWSELSLRTYLCINTFVPMYVRTYLRVSRSGGALTPISSPHREAS